MNNSNMSGYIGNELELRKTQTGTSVIEINLAVKLNKDETEWHKWVAYDKKAEFIHQYFSKGSFILLSGQARSKKYTNKDGQTRYNNFFDVREVDFGGKAKDDKRENVYGSESLMKDEHEPTPPPFDEFADLGF